MTAFDLPPKTSALTLPSESLFSLPLYRLLTPIRSSSVYVFLSLAVSNMLMQLFDLFSLLPSGNKVFGPADLG